MYIVLTLGDRAGEGYAYGNLGCTYHKLGQFEKAIKFHRKALAVTLEVGDRTGERKAYGNLYRSHSQLGEIDKANYFQQKAQDI